MKSSILKKIRSTLFVLTPITTLTFLISCGQQNEMAISKSPNDSSQNLNQKKDDSTSHSVSQNTDISTIKSEIIDSSSLEKVKTQLELKINQLPVDQEVKDQKLKQLKRNLHLIKNAIDTDGIDADQTKLLINSLDGIFTIPPKKTEIQFRPEAPVSKERVDTFKKEVADAKPKGQNVAEFKDGVRVVKDQYKYDVPKNEINYALLEFPFLGGSQSATYEWKPSKEFGEWNGDHPPKYSPELEQLAKQIDQPLPQNAYYRTFVTPDPNNRDLLHLPTTKRNLPVPPISFYKRGPKKGQVDTDASGPWHFGLPRDIISDEYLKLIDGAMSVTIGDGTIGTKEVVGPDGQKHFEEDYRDPGEERGNLDAKRGTMNILDYQIKDGESYPLTWYFVTNTHVISQLRLKNDQGDGVYGRDKSNYDTYNKAYNTQEINISKLKKDKVKLNKIIPLVGQGDWNDYYDQIKIEPDQVKLVMIGSKVMKDNLDDYTKQPFWKDVHFLMDIGIIEITFKDVEQAKQVTEDWYNSHHNLNTSGNYVVTSDVNLLDGNQYSKLPKNPFYTLGFPTSEFEKFIPEVGLKIPENNGRSFDKPEIENILDGSISPLINKPSKLFPQARITPEQQKKLDALKPGGGDLNWTRSFRSFMSKPGQTDIFVAAPFLDDGGLILENYNSSTHKFENNDLYVFSGLGTLLDNMSGHGGMSGSGVYLNNKLWGLIYMSGPNASVAGVLNLRSYGYNYQGYYGKYNLPQYDLIYGGGKNQVKSYFDAMKHMYRNKNVKTFLFPKGFDLSHRVDVFKTTGNDLPKSEL